MTFAYKKGFTFVELMVVVILIGILSTIVAVSYGKSQTKARDAKRRSDIQSIATAMEMYKANNKKYPESITPSGSGSCGQNNNYWWYCGIILRGITTGEDPLENGATSNFVSEIRPYLPSLPVDPSFNAGASNPSQPGTYWYILSSSANKFYLRSPLEAKGIKGTDMPGGLCTGALGGSAGWTDVGQSAAGPFCYAGTRCGAVYDSATNKCILPAE